MNKAKLTSKYEVIFCVTFKCLKNLFQIITPQSATIIVLYLILRDYKLQTFFC